VALTVPAPLVQLLAAALTLAVASQAPPHVSVEGTGFRKGSRAFEWRGITAFRLAEQIARGREREAAAYLDWAKSRKLTVVRVLLMAHHLFRLNPNEGRAALPRLLEMSAARGLHVEIVALADTDEIALDHAEHVRAVGAIAARHHNAIVEVANEPWHPTQDRRLHDPAYVGKLASLIPPAVPVALGSVERDGGYATGRYITWHSPRSEGNDGWDHVLASADGAALIAKWKKPVVSDEPIGAAPKTVPGRRESDPARFGAAAAVTRVAGLGATFHYEGGLQARLPSGRELDCFEAWARGLDLLAGLPDGGTFLGADAVGNVAKITGARAAFAREVGDSFWLVVVDPAAGLSVVAAKGWRLEAPLSGPGVKVYRARR
jgi:hypothetical protein